MDIPVLADVISARQRVAPYIHRTPVLTSTLVDKIAGCKLFLKCENFQKSGAFKYRGATNAILTLGEEARQRGVITHSSGNHAGALSRAAVSRGVRAMIVMPHNAPAIKRRAVEDYGAEITFCEPTLASREETAAELVATTGGTLVHAYDNFFVIAGQGTAAIELMEDVDNLDILVAPVGGGGLLSGTITAVRGLKPGITVIGAEPAGADDARRSFLLDDLIPSVNPDTIADGLRTSLSERTFSIIKGGADDIVTVSEEMIKDSMLLVWERMKIVIEASSATAIAAVREHPSLFSGKRTGVIITGGNVDLKSLPF